MAGWDDYGDWSSSDAMLLSQWQGKYIALIKALDERRIAAGLGHITGYDLEYFEPMVTFSPSGFKTLRDATITRYINHTSTELIVPFWTLEDILTELGEEEITIDYFAHKFQSAWFKQQYDIINLLRQQPITSDISRNGIGKFARTEFRNPHPSGFFFDSNGELYTILSPNVRIDHTWDGCQITPDGCIPFISFGTFVNYCYNNYPNAENISSTIINYDTVRKIELGVITATKQSIGWSLNLKNTSNVTASYNIISTQRTLYERIQNEDENETYTVTTFDEDELLGTLEDIIPEQTLTTDIIREDYPFTLPIIDGSADMGQVSQESGTEITLRDQITIQPIYTVDTWNDFIFKNW